MVWGKNSSKQKCHILLVESHFFHPTVQQFLKNKHFTISCFSLVNLQSPETVVLGHFSSFIPLFFWRTFVKFLTIIEFCFWIKTLNELVRHVSTMFFSIYPVYCCLIIFIHFLKKTIFMLILFSLMIKKKTSWDDYKTVKPFSVIVSYTYHTTYL